MGSVMFDDGTSPNSDIRIERICGGSKHLETHTDSKGRFSFQVGGEAGGNIADADFTNSTFGGKNNAGKAAGSGLMGCELRAAYPGYLSETVDISSHHSMDDPKVGVILLHRLSEVKGTTISLTTAQAPKGALKSYEKGMQLAQKGRFDEAAQKFSEATVEYPKYAEAWYSLGRVQQQLNKPADAAKSFMAAVNADSHFVSPYDALARLSALQSQWPDALKYSKQVIDLNPLEFPSSFWYNALANYNLKNNAEAEKSARALIKIDSKHQFAEAETMLVEFAVGRGDLDDAAAHLRKYLAIAPNSKNADALKRELASIDEARATQARNAIVLAVH
jgi:tetratricopeptide (TPR) repeat protein